MRVLVRSATPSKKVAVILRIPSYCGEDTCLEVGGERITEHTGGTPLSFSCAASELCELEPNEPCSTGVMYALITFERGNPNSGTADYGYATPKEALETLRARGSDYADAEKVFVE